MKINGKKIIAGVVSSALLAGMFPTSVFATDLDLQQAVQRQLTAQNIDSLTIQPGETSASINLNWYAPEGTTNSVLQFATNEDVTTMAAIEFALTEPTKLDASKYTDSDKVGCRVTVDGLEPDTQYTYKISNDGGASWSQEYSYKTLRQMGLNLLSPVTRK